MKMLILNVEKQSELAALNASGDATRQLGAIALTNGNAALTTALLSDCGPGQTWEHYGDYLKGLPIAEVASKQIVESQIA